MDTTDAEDRGWVRALAWIGGVMLLFFALCPAIRGKGGGTEEQTHVRLGISFSPLYEYERTRSEEPDAAGSKSVTVTTRSDFSFLSLSMGALVAGIAAISLAISLGRAARVREG